MKLLLDTHALLWLDSEPEKLSVEALKACEAAENELYLSVASLWEIQIKTQIQRLDLHLPIEEIISVQRTDNGLNVLPIAERHVYALQQLPMHHKDPFDRLILATALAEGLMVVSRDGVFADYPVAHLW